MFCQGDFFNPILINAEGHSTKAHEPKILSTILHVSENIYRIQGDFRINLIINFK